MEICTEPNCHAPTKPNWHFPITACQYKGKCLDTDHIHGHAFKPAEARQSWIVILRDKNGKPTPMVHRMYEIAQWDTKAIAEEEGGKHPMGQQFGFVVYEWPPVVANAS